MRKHPESSTTHQLVAGLDSRRSSDSGHVLGHALRDLGLDGQQGAVGHDLRTAHTP